MLYREAGEDRTPGGKAVVNVGHRNPRLFGPQGGFQMLREGFLGIVFPLDEDTDQ
jgi:hypothetical protein